MPSALDAIVGGWQLNGIYRISSGQAFDVRRNGVRVNASGEVYTGRRDPYLNRAAFSDPAAGTFGNLEETAFAGESEPVESRPVEELECL